MSERDQCLEGQTFHEVLPEGFNSELGTIEEPRGWQLVRGDVVYVSLRKRASSEVEVRRCLITHRFLEKAKSTDDWMYRYRVRKQNKDGEYSKNYSTVYPIEICNAYEEVRA